MNCTYSECNITPHVNKLFTSFKLAYYIQFLFSVFHRFFARIALDDVDLHLSLTSIREAKAVGEGTTGAARLYHQRNQFIHVTDGMTVTSLSASLLQKMSTATDCLCQTVLNQKLPRKFKTWRKFSSRVKAKPCKKKSHASRAACIQELFKIQNTDLINS